MSRRDLAIAAAFTAAAVAEAFLVDLEGGSRAVTVACALVAGAAIGLRRIAPVVAAAAVVGALVGKDAFGGAEEIVLLLLAGVVTTFSMGAHVPSPRSELALAGLIALSGVAIPFGDDGVGEIVFSAIVLGAPWAAGRLVRDRTERAAIVAELAERRRRDAEDRARLAAAEERARIARELHDLVGHSVSLMVLTAGAAEQVAREQPETAVKALGHIRRTGREAVEELRRVLALLREEGEADPRDPLPGMDDLTRLVAEVREAGLDVSLAVEGEPAPLPEGMSLAAFRVVQEALTNVAKHAAGARVQVRVRYGDARLRLEVLNDEGVDVAGIGAGHGLLGMRERVAMYGGAIEVGPAAGGGFRVSAELPLPEPA